MREMQPSLDVVPRACDDLYLGGKIGLVLDGSFFFKKKIKNKNTSRGDGYCTAKPVVNKSEFFFNGEKEVVLERS